MENRYNKDYYKRTNEGGFEQENFEEINKIEEDTNLLFPINKWLERMPFFENDPWENYQINFPADTSLHIFWSDYRQLYKNGLNPREAGRINDFDSFLSD